MADHSDFTMAIPITNRERRDAALTVVENCDYDVQRSTEQLRMLGLIEARAEGGYAPCQVLDAGPWSTAALTTPWR